MSRSCCSDLRRRGSALVLLAGTLCVVSVVSGRPLHAQVRLIEPDAVQASNLGDSFLTLSAGGCAVRYRSGGLDRAHHVLRRLDLITRQLNEWSAVPVPLAVYLLDRPGWSDLGMRGVYGVPERTGPNAVALAAEGDPGTVGLWRELLQAPAVPLVPGVPLRGTPEEAGTLAIADVLLQIEAARGFVQRAGLLGERAWIGEVAAHVAALSLFDRHERSRLPEIVALFRRMEEATEGHGPFSLESFSPTPGPADEAELRRWLWYQARFFGAARLLIDKHGRKTVARLQKLSGPRGVLGESELLAEYDQLREWHRNLGSGFPQQ
ncbi:MAG TPA: hypothetical protein VNB06_10055 [Thermoanaerobaculia bacterium]|nr:hypothetical protein [Thermoanaerobaculia bacterium]